jgi:hypothetical protein
MPGGRLGERLVEAGVISEEWLEESLEAQVVHGGRLGTNLVERFHLDLDDVALALGEQHGLPAALQEHFDGADRTVQQSLDAELAARWHVVPLGVVGEGRQRIAVACRDPLPPDAIDELTLALGTEITPAIACGASTTSWRRSTASPGPTASSGCGRAHRSTSRSSSTTRRSSRPASGGRRRRPAASAAAS